MFFTRTPEDFIEFMHAQRPDPRTGKPDAAKIGAFLEEHPETLPSVTALQSLPIPSSYAQVTYYAVHVFKFVDGDGTVRPARFHLVPAAGEAAITEDDGARRPPDYLNEEFERRLAAGPVTFYVDLEFAADMDPIEDPTAVWPEGRRRERVAELRITAPAFDLERDGEVLAFDPTRLTDGIEATDDPVLRARSGAYHVSAQRRSAALSDN